MKKMMARAALCLLALSAAPQVFADDQDATVRDPVASPESATDVNLNAWCVGGPRYPSYAYWNYELARECARHVRREGRECRHEVRVGRCYVRNRFEIGTVRPFRCECDPGFRPVGRWIF